MAHIARKRFGQHFLTAVDVIDRIIRAIGPKAGERLVEIGPGLGAMTIPLRARCDALTVVELDRDLAERLRRRARALPTALLPAPPASQWRLPHPASWRPLQGDRARLLPLVSVSSALAVSGSGCRAMTCPLWLPRLPLSSRRWSCCSAPLVSAAASGARPLRLTRRPVRLRQVLRPLRATSRPHR